MHAWHAALMHGSLPCPGARVRCSWLARMHAVHVHCVHVPAVLHALTHALHLPALSVAARRGAHACRKLDGLITTKPVIYLVNMTAGDFIRKKNKWLAKIHAWVQEHGGGLLVPLSVEWEEKLWTLKDDPDGKAKFLEESTGAVSSLPKVVLQVRPGRGPQGHRASGRQGHSAGVFVAWLKHCAALPSAKRLLPARL